MDLRGFQSKSLIEICHIAAQARRLEIDTFLYEKFSGVVQDGPFKGMLLPPETAWNTGDLSPKLLGTYESELHGVIKNVIERDYTTIVNIGCAEGYYAVGFALTMPHARVIAFDIDPNAQRICQTAAQSNHVSEHMEVRGNCDGETLRDIFGKGGKTFLFLDCEGAEKDLLSLTQVPQLYRCDFVVECHDFIDRDITATLSERFAKTHAVTCIREGSRNPNQNPVLHALTGLDRSLAVCEFRPETMCWLVFQHH